MIDNLLLETGDALLLEDGGLLLLEAQASVVTEPEGGNLTKPRLHQGNAPGPTIKQGRGSFLYKLTITGVGYSEQPGTLAMPSLTAVGEINDAHSHVLAHRCHSHGLIASRTRRDLTLEARAVGTASEDPDDVLFALL